jgi:hypothetical protein
VSGAAYSSISFTFCCVAEAAAEHVFPWREAELAIEVSITTGSMPPCPCGIRAHLTRPRQRRAGVERGADGKGGRNPGALGLMTFIDELISIPL